MADMTDEQRRLIQEYERKQERYAKAEPGCKTAHWRSLKLLVKDMLEAGA